MSSIINQISEAVTGTSNTGAGKTVLVTGASGFVAAHVLNEFLGHGYRVVGTVRSQASADKVRKTHAKYGDKLSFAIVEDVAVSGAHDEAVKGVDGVIHTASPFQMQVDDNEKELLKPAMEGTRSVLTSIAKHNSDVKRVVITSSFSSIVNLEKGAWSEHTYNEADWNPVTYETAKSADGATAYCASKTFAEKLAFDFVKDQKPSFDISTICPPMVYGPSDHNPDLTKLNTSSADIYRLMDGSTKEVPDTSFFAEVDVRDVAKAHRLAYESEKAAGERYFTTAGGYTYQDICDILRQIPEIKDKVPEGKPGSGKDVLEGVYKVDNSKAQKLGISFIPLEKTIKDMAHQFLKIQKASA